MAVITPISARPSELPPRTMGRDDRRLIFAEIDGCYDKEARRYMDGWHDERVAKALGSHVPRAWVTEIREDFFGPSGSSQEFDEYLSALKAADERVASIIKMHGVLTSEKEALEKMMEPLRRLAKSVEKAIGK